MANSARPSTERLALEARIRELESEIRALNSSDFQLGLVKGGYSVIAGLVAMVASLFGILTLDKDQRFSSTTFIIIVAIFAVSALVYFSFVFGRKFVLSMELSKAKRQLNVGSGDRV